MQAPLLHGGCMVFVHCAVACYSRVTQASLPQLGPLQAFQPMPVPPSPGKAADPVHQFYIKAAGRACCWSEKQSASFCCLCPYRKDLLLLTVPCERVLSLHSSCYFLHLFLLHLMCFGAEFLSSKLAACSLALSFPVHLHHI